MSLKLPVVVVPGVLVVEPAVVLLVVLVALVVVPLVVLVVVPLVVLVVVPLGVPVVVAGGTGGVTGVGSGEGFSQLNHKKAGSTSIHRRRRGGIIGIRNSDKVLS